MFGLFRRVAWVEGVTTLVLFLVAMPAKYLAGQAGLVPPVGWIHGIAFIVYVVLMVPALWGRQVGAVGWLRTLGGRRESGVNGSWHQAPSTDLPS